VLVSSTPLTLSHNTQPPSPPPDPHRLFGAYPTSGITVWCLLSSPTLNFFDIDIGEVEGDGKRGEGERLFLLERLRVMESGGKGRDCSCYIEQTIFTIFKNELNWLNLAGTVERENKQIRV